MTINNQTVADLSKEASFLLTFKNTNATSNQHRGCFYWVPNNSTWSSAGCMLVSNDGVITMCRCNHLTNFAVLFNFNNDADANLDPANARALTYLTYIGCSRKRFMSALESSAFVRHILNANRSVDFSLISFHPRLPIHVPHLLPVSKTTQHASPNDTAALWRHSRGGYHLYGWNQCHTPFSSLLSGGSAPILLPSGLIFLDSVHRSEHVQDARASKRKTRDE